VESTEHIQKEFTGKFGLSQDKDINETNSLLSMKYIIVLGRDPLVKWYHYWECNSFKGSNTVFYKVDQFKA